MSLPSGRERARSRTLMETGDQLRALEIVKVALWSGLKRLGKTPCS